MADITCSKHTAWYSCASGFRGCCSVDPCGLEICPDHSNGQMTKSALTTWSTWTERPASASTLTTLSMSPSSTTAEAASTTEFESLTRDNVIKAATSSVTEKAMVTPTSTLSKLDAQPTPASNLVSSSHRLRSTKIGAIVGGVISLVLILCLIAYFIRRTRKKRGRVGRQFTLLRWRHRCLEEKQMSLEEEIGTTPGTMDFHAQAKGQPPLVLTHDVVIGEGSRTGFMSRQKQPQNIPGEQSPVVPLIQKRETDSPGSIPSMLTPSPSPLAALEPAISPKTSLNLQSAFTPTPPLPAAIHPALHSGQGKHAHHRTAYWPSSCTPEMSRCSNANIITNTADAHADAHEQPHSRNPSTTPELFDTGFYLGRVELPTTCSRELINIPFAERQRQRQKSQLHRSTTHLLSITTPDGAVLSPNFNGLPVHTGACIHALSSPYNQEPGPVELRPEKRASKEQKEIQKQKHKHKLLPLNLLPPLPLPPSPSRPPLTSSSLSSGPLSSPTPSS